jgi:hypothetical protein
LIGGASRLDNMGFAGKRWLASARTLDAQA